MKIEEYREYLQEQNIPKDAIETQMSIIGDFVKFLTDFGLKEITAAARKEEVADFARKLIDEERNTPEKFGVLCDYADWLGHRKLYVAMIELMDCHNAMEVLADEIEERHGRELRDLIFWEALPPLGADEKKRCAYTRMITERMSKQIAPKEIRAA